MLAILGIGTLIARDRVHLTRQISTLASDRVLARWHRVGLGARGGITTWPLRGLDHSDQPVRQCRRNPRRRRREVKPRYDRLVRHRIARRGNVMRSAA